MRRPAVFIATASFGELDGSVVDPLRKAGFEIRRNPLGRTLKPEEIAEHIASCVGVVAGTERYGAELLARQKDLKVISRCGAGLDSIDLAAAARLGIRVVSTPFGPTQAVAELTLGFILSLIRHVPDMHGKLRRGEWKKRTGFLIGELTVGIVGLGRIGRRLAEMLRGLGAQVAGCDKALDRAWAKRCGVRAVSWPGILRAADVLCLHIPWEPALRHMLGRRELNMLKPGSFLVNTSRGGLVDEAALTAALKSGRLAGAAVDTFEEEPYRGPLRDLDNVILTPHIGSYARAGRIKMERDAAENLVRELSRRGAKR